jgi:hypothetical protein
MLAEDHSEVYEISRAVWHDKDGGDIALSLMPEYREWAYVFSTEKSNKLPKNSGFDHHINLKPGIQLPLGPLYH